MCVCVCARGGGGFGGGGGCALKLTENLRKSFSDGCNSTLGSICIYSATVASIMIMTTEPGSAEIDPLYTERVTFLQRGVMKVRGTKKRSKWAFAFNCDYFLIISKVTVVLYNYNKYL